MVKQDKKTLIYLILIIVGQILVLGMLLILQISSGMPLSRFLGSHFAPCCGILIGLLISSVIKAVMRCGINYSYIVAILTTLSLVVTMAVCGIHPNLRENNYDCVLIILSLCNIFVLAFALYKQIRQKFFLKSAIN